MKAGSRSPVDTQVIEELQDRVDELERHVNALQTLHGADLGRKAYQELSEQENSQDIRLALIREAAGMRTKKGSMDFPGRPLPLQQPNRRRAMSTSSCSSPVKLKASTTRNVKRTITLHRTSAKSIRSKNHSPSGTRNRRRRSRETVRDRFRSRKNARPRRAVQVAFISPRPSAF